jgi:hypothetical protein
MNGSSVFAALVLARTLAGPERESESAPEPPSRDTEREEPAVEEVPNAAWLPMPR